MDIILEICLITQSIMFGSILGQILTEMIKTYKEQKDSSDK
jgi:uncharacterized membrane protein YjjB (DUF3815 family)